ncbi:MAG: helix-turn-helix domain-containing protein [Lachnospiraceae bacterium]
MSACKAGHCPCGETCPLQVSLKRIGGKWKIPILCVLSCEEGIRYNELMKKVQGITNTMLAASLKELEKDGLITRVQYNEMPIRVEYFITDKSIELMPTLQSLAIWGMT